MSPHQELKPARRSNPWRWSTTNTNHTPSNTTDLGVRRAPNVVKIGRRVILLASVATALIMAAASTALAASYQVVGVGTGTLRVHPSPSASAAVIRTLPNHTWIDIVCQTTGDSVQGSSIWDQIDSPIRGYVADWYTTTPAPAGTFTTSIPRCGAPPTPTPSDVSVALSMNGQVVVPAAIANAFRIGPYWSGFCEGFVGYATRGLSGRGYGSAMADYRAHRNLGEVHTGPPPAGAVVYWNTGGAGHIGISIGNGQEISTYGYYGNRYPIQIHSYLYFPNYLGWVYPNQ
jgi:hypothetical protein